MLAGKNSIFVKNGQIFRATSRAWWLPRALQKGKEVVVARIAAEDTFSSYLVDLTEQDLEIYRITPGLICNDNSFVMDGARPSNNRADDPLSQETQRELSGWPLVDSGQLRGTESDWGRATG